MDLICSTLSHHFPVESVVIGQTPNSGQNRYEYSKCLRPVTVRKIKY